MVTTSDPFEDVVGVLTEADGFEGPPDDLLRAVRVAAAIVMLRRSGFELTLLPAGAVAPIPKKFRRRRWWRR